MSGPGGLLRGADRAAFAIALVEALRARGVPVGLTAAAAFVEALRAHPPDTRSRLYWAARITLVRRESELAAFDALFAEVFDAVLAADPNARRTGLPGRGADDEQFAPVGGRGEQDETGAGLPWATLPTVVGTAEDADAADPGVPLRLPAGIAVLADTPFEQLGPEQLRALGQWLAAAAQYWPVRRSRRTRSAPLGRTVALRPTLARARRTGWEPVELMRARPVTRPRRVVAVCDVSESMRAQASAYVHLMRALVLATDAEAFAFGVKLTRLTAVLRHHSAEVAMDRTAAQVSDRFAGTRIAANVRALLRSHHGEALRGAVVLIGSDGWDSDPPDQLAAAMARLRRRAHRVVWMNPRAGAAGFEPAVGAMAAALPYCDAFLPADTFAALAGVLDEISSTASRGSRAGTARR